MRSDRRAPDRRAIHRLPRLDRSQPLSRSARDTRAPSLHRLGHAATTPRWQADRIDRVYDTYASEDEFVENDEWIADFVLTLERRPCSSRELLYRSGEHLVEADRPRRHPDVRVSRRTVPIFCPAIADSSIGMGLSQARHRDPHARARRRHRRHHRIGEPRDPAPANRVDRAAAAARRRISSTRRACRPSSTTTDVGGHQLRAADRDRRAALRRRLGLEPRRGAAAGASWPTDAEQVTVHADATIALPLIGERAGDERGADPRGARAACVSIWRVATMAVDGRPLPQDRFEARE